VARRLVTKGGSLSLRAYARHRGVALNAAQDAIKAGRIGTDANGKIDPGQADKDWDANTSHGHRRNTAKEIARNNQGKNAAEYARVRTIKERIQAKLLDLELKEKQRELLPAREVETEWSKLVVAFRTRILAVPSKIRSTMPDATPAVVIRIEELIREALEELAGGSGSG
jgi:phage terminase Nu1 subunit (DNA packaging protein)